MKKIILLLLFFFYASLEAQTMDDPTQLRIQSLEGSVKREPNDGTFVFELAQAYTNTAQYSKALDLYEKRIALGGNVDQVFWSLYTKGQIQEVLQQSPDTYLTSYNKAAEYQRNRAEPLFRMASYFMNNQNYLLGYLLAKEALPIPLPKQVPYQPSVYEYEVLLTFATCAHEIHQYAEAAEAWNQIISKKTIPEKVRAAAEHNLALTQQFLPKTQPKPKQPKKERSMPFLEQNKREESKPMSFYIDYKGLSSDLCLLGAYYDTDKSSQRKNVSNLRHCHPYTLFYDSLFKNKKDAKILIAELGILHGSSLLMWKDYFKNAKLFGFEYNPDFINHFKKSFNNKRVSLSEIDVTKQSSITDAFKSAGKKFDLIIDDTTHVPEDQVRVIQNVHQYLKPGGMLVIEDVFKTIPEHEFLTRLDPILDQFQDYYFVTMDHKNRYSAGGDNDKLFVLVKAGEEPVFKSNKKITIITPCMRPENLPKLKESIDFNYVDEWIIVYDGSKISKNPKMFAKEKNSKIREYIHTSEGKSGNPQRNYALDRVKNENTHLYFLDDDNTIHKDLYKFLDIMDDGKMYTFDQENRVNGDKIEFGYMDAAMVLIDFKLCKSIRWDLNKYSADFDYIHECYSKNKDKWVYVHNVLCTYNSLSDRKL